MDTHTLQQAPPSSVRHGNGEPERRMRTVGEKKKIVKETLVPGVSVAEVARRHSVNANLLFTWRRQYQQSVLESRTRAPRAVKLLPVKIEEPTRPSSGTIEIEWPDKVRVRLIGDVSAEQLSAVLSALSR